MKIRIVSAIVISCIALTYIAYHQYKTVANTTASVSGMIKSHIQGSVIAPVSEKLAFLSTKVTFDQEKKANLNSSFLKYQFLQMIYVSGDVEESYILHQQSLTSTERRANAILASHSDTLPFDKTYLFATAENIFYIYRTGPSLQHKKGFFLVAVTDISQLFEIIDNIEIPLYTETDLISLSEEKVISANPFPHANAPKRQLTGTSYPLNYNVRKALTSNIMLQKSGYDGTYGLYSHKQVGSSNLVVRVGIDVAKTFSHSMYAGFIIESLLLIGGLAILFITRRLASSEAHLHELQNSLTDSENQAKLIFALSEQAIVVIDKAYRCKLVNDVAVRLFDIDCNESLINKRLKAEEFGFPKPLMLSLITKALKKHESSAVIEDYQTPSGKLLPIQIDVYPNVTNKQVTGCVLLFKDTSDQVKAQNKIKQMAYNDTLTGLPNRWYFEEQFNSQARQYEATKNIFCVVLGLDNFKSVNDSFGHMFGDDILKKVATRLVSERVSNIKSIARLVSDEFILLIEANDHESLQQLLKHLISVIARPLISKGNFKLSISASVGVSRYPDHGTNFDELLTTATMAMYQAKKKGRGATCIYYDLLGMKAKKELRLQSELSDAIQNDELALYYQPKHNGSNGYVSGLEALVRWNHPEKGMISPADFIPIAESTGLIIPLSQWVFREAFQFSVRLQQLNLATPIAVNASSLHFTKGFAKDIDDLLRDTSAIPSWLEIELTESLLIENSVEVKQVVKKLKRMGFSLSIDDFGTGFSNLSYLYHLAVDKIKIDKSFIRNIDTNEHKSRIVESIITLAKNLSLSTVAEGVETAEELAYLQKLNCCEIQGYFYSRPLPEPETLTYLKHRTQAKESISKLGLK